LEKSSILIGFSKIKSKRKRCYW